jgi:hypothetical protein
MLVPLSLGLCLAMAALWTSSFFWYASLTNASAFTRASTNRKFLVYSHAGMIEFTSWAIQLKNPPPDSDSIWQLTAWHAKGVLQDLQSEFLMGVTKFRWRAGTMPLRRGLLAEEHFWISYAFPTVLFAVAPAAWLRRFVRRRAAIKTGHCQHCGYDLRASPGRCPECGTIPASPVAAIPSSVNRHPTV